MMAQEKLVDLEVGSVFSGNPLVENYVVKAKNIVVQKSVHDNGMKCVIDTKTIPFATQDDAQTFATNEQKKIDENLAVVSNPYLIYSVHSEDNLLHPCRSVYVKYGIVVPTSFRGPVPVLSPKGYTSVRYDANCSGLCEALWLGAGKMPKLKFQDVPEDIKLPDSWRGKTTKYAFIDSAFFFEEIEFARMFRDDMLIQQALRRYLFYKKVEKTW